MIKVNEYFKINVWVNPDKILNFNVFVGPQGKFVMYNDKFGIKKAES